MKHKYKVIAEMPIKDNILITLDNPRRDDDLRTEHVIINGEKTPYQLTHSESLIILKGSIGYLGKEITFC